MVTPSKILIIRLSSIGDIVLTTPLLRVLRAKFPYAKIDFIIHKEYADLLKFNTNLNTLYEFEKSKGICGLRELKKELRKENYELIIDIHNNLRSKYLRLGNNAKQVKINKRIFARTLLIKSKKNYYKRIIPIPYRYIETVKDFGIYDDNKGLELNIPETIRLETNSLLNNLGIKKSDKVIGFCPSAKHYTKCWPKEYYLELGKILVKTGLKIFLFGSEADFTTCKFITDEINNTDSLSAINLSGKLNLLQTASAIDCCNLIVTNDTGLMHIACALKKGIIAIFGPTVKEFGFFPIGQNCIVIENNELKCRPCSHIGSAKCPEGHFKCMREIKADKIFEIAKTSFLQ